jgi:hypothetical protein
MTKDIQKRSLTVFEQILRTDESGNEFWSARDLAKVLEYSEYRHFIPVINRAKESCKNSGQKPADHFEDDLEMVPIGSSAERQVHSVKLSRYACYLIVQNADPAKKNVLLGQSYFAVQTSGLVIQTQQIKESIYFINNVQVMIDRDLAILYQTETRTIKQAVKRNVERFPRDFMFELTESDVDKMVSQFVIPSKKYFGGAKPYAFTEQGVAMLSAVIRTPIAIDVSLQIIRAFVEMRKMVTENAVLFQRLDRIEFKQLETDHKFEQVFKALESHNKLPDKGIFFDGQIFDAWQFVSDLVRKAIKSILLIDNYIDDTVLGLFIKREKGVAVTIYTKNIGKQLAVDVAKHNAQYEPIAIKEFAASHDRFLLIDETELYHIGASLKDLGKKWFAFSKMDSQTLEIINLLKIKINE